MAEAALKQINLPVAESAFIRSQDYAGILFIKKWQSISNETLRKASIAMYFKQFDEAEKLYFEADRRYVVSIAKEFSNCFFFVLEIWLYL